MLAKDEVITTTTVSGRATEEWRYILGYEGWYEVSDKGWARDARTGRILHHWETVGGYLQVSLYRDGCRTTCYIHRLVAFAFLPPPLSGQVEVCHIDHNPSNNCADNLEWGTRLENEQAKVRADRQAVGCKNGRAKLTEDNVRIIRRLRKEGWMLQSLAAKFGGWSYGYMAN